jgi:hypothetical protein
MKKILFGIFILSLITSCNIEENNSMDRNWISIATVENPTLSSSFHFLLDNGDRLFSKTTNLLNYHPKDGQRIIANYTILSNTDENNSHNYDVKLNDVYEILTKGVLKIKPQQQDSIGNNQIEIKNIWIGSNYLNVEFAYLGLDKTHYINLVSDSTKTYSDNKIHLEFRHNANSDSPSYSKWGMASFDLRSLKAQSIPGDSLNLVIHTREYTGSIDKTYPLTYKFKVLSPVLFVKKVAFPVNAGNKIR